LVGEAGAQTRAAVAFSRAALASFCFFDMIADNGKR
jgi:hypothetical protein